GLCDNQFRLIREWTAIDNCGNSVSKSQVITVGDGTPPVLLNIPQDLTVECNNIPDVPASVTATDNCDDQVDIHFSEAATPLGCENSYRLVRTWTAEDNCGNHTSQSQIII